MARHSGAENERFQEALIFQACGPSGAKRWTAGGNAHRRLDFPGLFSVLDIRNKLCHFATYGSVGPNKIDRSASWEAADTVTFGHMALWQMASYRLHSQALEESFHVPHLYLNQPV